MSESKHTKEPWATDRNYAGRTDYDLLVEDWMNGDSPMVRGGDEGQHEVVQHSAFHSAHDYARAMICVNSCEGIDDPERAIPAMREALQLSVLMLGVEARAHRDNQEPKKAKAVEGALDKIAEALRLAEGGES